MDKAVFAEVLDPLVDPDTVEFVAWRGEAREANAV